MKRRVAASAVSVAVVAASVWIGSTAASADELCFMTSPAHTTMISCEGYDSFGYSGYTTEADSLACYDLAGNAEYSVSSSSTDPDQSSGPIAPGQDLFLWLRWYDGWGYGVYMIERAGLSGEIQVVGYEPIAGTGSFDSEDYALQFVAVPGCFPGFPLLLGRILTAGAAVSVAEPEARMNWGRVKSAYR